MPPLLTASQGALVEHLTAHFGGRELELFSFTEGPVERRLPGFHEVLVPPGKPGGVWTYVSCGAWDAVHHGEHGLEFCLLAPERDDRHALSVAMIAHYHANPDESYELDVGHTVPIGEPWVPGSALDHQLICQPYPFGPDFEMCRWDGGHARVLWVLPITESERDFKVEHGLEALEQRFEDAGLRYWDPHRDPIV
jgi:hypothetical protein